MKGSDIHKGMVYVNALGTEVNVLDVLPFGQVVLGAKGNTMQWGKPTRQVLEELNSGDAHVVSAE